MDVELNEETVDLKKKTSKDREWNSARAIVGVANCEVLSIIFVQEMGPRVELRRKVSTQETGTWGGK